ncbi:Gfo/Idh/MocA family oxidoreductase [Paenibacillus sp. CC-CFT747]|nr:Gfo/Idh/MocA family oxidoreductase [Paenibacillus sp. CC-CFT747]
MKARGAAVIGCGSVASFHLNAIRSTDRVRLVGIAGRREEAVRPLAEQEGCRWTTDYRELLRDPSVELVCLTTGSGSHAVIGREVLEAGKPLLVEKPLAMTSAEAAELVRLARRKGLLLSTVSQRRFEPQHQEVHRVLAEGALGRLLLVEVGCPYYRTQEYYDSADWRGTIREDGGVLMNQAIHSLDLMLWLAGGVAKVTGRTATQAHRMEAEDLGLALLTFRSGTFGTVMASTSIQPGFPPYLHFYGEKGTIKLAGSGIRHWAVPGWPEPAGQEETGEAYPIPAAFPTGTIGFSFWMCWTR